MTHFASRSFWEAYDQLPKRIQKLADRNFQLLKANPSHGSLQFKLAGRNWSARIGLHYRALAHRSDDDFLWFWIGSHAEYDRLIG